MIHQIELPIIEALQNTLKNLQPIWLAITYLGDQTLYLLVMPMIYWCVDALVGMRIGAVLLLSGFGNGFIKIIIKSPRPYWLSDKITAGAEHNSFGLPSGHAMNSAAVWGWTAHEIRQDWAKWVMGLMIFLIGFSRIALGVHFISDVLLGWTVGLLLVWVLARNMTKLGKNLMKMPMKFQLLMVALTSGLMILLPVLVRALSPGWQPPAEWVQRAGPIDPMNLEFSLTLAGLWLGFLGGFVLLMHQKGILQSNHGTWQKIVRYLIGMAGVIVLYAGLGTLFPDDMSLPGMVLRFVRYTLIGLWISWGSPLLFEKMSVGVIKPYLPPQTTAAK